MHTKDRPTIFLRVFLSHLLLLLVSFITVAALYSYLFAPGVKLFLARSPMLILPAILGLIGIAGMLALWTSAAIAIPLDELADRLAHRHDRKPTHHGAMDSGTKEVGRLADLLNAAIPASIERAPEESAVDSPAPVGSLIVDVDNEFRITGVSASVELLFSMRAEEIAGKPFHEVFSDPGHRTAVHEALHSIVIEGREVEDFPTTITLTDGTPCAISWDGMHSFDAQGGFTGRKLFGAPRAPSEPGR